ncbi:MAG: type II toxin-antitoxin system VapB family antitoxin [Deltaproteobacteria bacterium]|nr:type II toxin-antitoxin system VapB family antitoxin [Deltaproteobacteria bacterium]
MATNLSIDEKLLEEALELGRFKSKKETVNEALAMFVRAHRRRKILDLAGKIEWDPNYDYKKGRSRR